MPPVVFNSSYRSEDEAAKRPQTTARKKLALAIPTLQEAENLPGLLRQIRSVLDPVGLDYEILVVDDDSRDGTEEIVSAIALQDPRVRLLVRKGERGLSGAILYGWRHTDAAIFGVMDADLQHPPDLLPALISAILDGNDLAIGSRYTAGGDLGAWNPRQRPNDRILPAPPRMHRRNCLSALRLQAAVRDSGARSPALGRGSTFCLRQALPRCQQS